MVKLAVTSDSMYTVGWKPSLSDGGDSITMYRVEWDNTPGFTSGSLPPHKGYIDVDATVHSSYTVELLTPNVYYYVRVYAINNAGPSPPQNTSPKSVILSKQVPGTPHTLSANLGNSEGTVVISWQRPRVPHHGIPCSGTISNPSDCPTPFGGGATSSNGGDSITEYEIEYNERSDFGGSDGSRKLVTGTNCNLVNLTKGRTYYIRGLARNSIGSGRYCEKSGSNFCDNQAITVTPI